MNKDVPAAQRGEERSGQENEVSRSKPRRFSSLAQTMRRTNFMKNNFPHSATRISTAHGKKKKTLFQF